MIIEYDPDDWVCEWEHRKCSFHEKQPTKHYAGCTCTAWYTQRRKSEKEKEEERKIRDRPEDTRAKEE